MRRGLDPRRLEISLSRVLAVGILLSVALLVVGYVLLLWGGAESAGDDPLYYPNPTYELDPQALFEGVLQGEGLYILQLGLLVLALTPVARVVVAGFLFAGRREWVFAVVSAVILLVLGAAWRGI